MVSKIMRALDEYQMWSVAAVPGLASAH